jgi:hypothetical protein
MCGRPALILSHRAGCILLQPAGDSVEFGTEKLNNWINTMLMPTWRDFAERLKEAQKPFEQVYWDQLCDKLGVPHGTKFDAIPEDKQKEWRSAWDDFYSKPEYQYPEGFCEQPIPPGLPAHGIIGMMLKSNREEWEQALNSRQLRY